MLEINMNQDLWLQYGYEIVIDEKDVEVLLVRKNNSLPFLVVFKKDYPVDDKVSKEHYVNINGDVYEIKKTICNDEAPSIRNWKGELYINGYEGFNNKFVDRMTNIILHSDEQIMVTFYSLERII